MEEQDILNLIKNQIEESLNLEYKAAASLSKTSDKHKSEIAKDVSAFANSAGGTIIYGVKEYSDHEKRHLPEKIDPIKRLEFSKEWLEQIINTNITPRLSNISIEPITISSAPTDVVYVVTVPKSNTAHQASDKRYYKRFNFEATAMYDYEIRDVLNRAQTPFLKIEFEIETETYERQSDIPIPSYSNRKPDLVTTTELMVYSINEGTLLAKYVNCNLYIPEKLIRKFDNSEYKIVERDGINYVEHICTNTVREIVGSSGSGFYSRPNYGPSRYDPILPKTRKRIAAIHLENDLVLKDSKLYWTVYADNAEAIDGELSLSSIIVTDTSK